MGDIVLSLDGVSVPLRRGSYSEKFAAKVAETETEGGTRIFTTYGAGAVDSLDVATVLTGDEVAALLAAVGTVAEVQFLEGGANGAATGAGLIEDVALDLDSGRDSGRWSVSFSISMTRAAS